MFDDEYHLSFYISEILEDNVPDKMRQQGGVMMNNRYEEVFRVAADDSQGARKLDVHEFTFRPGAKSALASVTYFDEADASDIGQQGNRTIFSYGFQEIEVSTGKALFDWEPIRNGVSLNETIDMKNFDPEKSETFWDWFHLNSVDKNSAGDYLVSGRHTSTIYKVSGRDVSNMMTLFFVSELTHSIQGSVMWRLGGHRSDFKMQQGTHFEWQHHVRFISENETTTILTVFDNDSDDLGRNDEIPNTVSFAKMLKLDHQTMTATMLRAFKRPDGGLSQKCGSVQTIGDDPLSANLFVNWAQRSFISEYDGQNRLVLEAVLPSPRMWTYRAYKLPWVGFPKEPIALKCLPSITENGEAACTYYMSWNGATEVKFWSIYSGSAAAGPFERLATIRKVGFETAWTSTDIQPYVYVEGISSEGTVLGKSNVTAISIAKQWRYSTGTNADASEDDPEAEPSQTTESQDDSQGHIITSAGYLFVDGLALYALYVLAKTFLPTVLPAFMKKRNGYARVSQGSDEPILDAREVTVP